MILFILKCMIYTHAYKSMILLKSANDQDKKNERVAIRQEDFERCNKNIWHMCEKRMPM